MRNDTNGSFQLAHVSSSNDSGRFVQMAQVPMGRPEDALPPDNLFTDLGAVVFSDDFHPQQRSAKERA